MSSEHLSVISLVSGTDLRGGGSPPLPRKMKINQIYIVKLSQQICLGLNSPFPVDISWMYFLSFIALV